MVTMKEGEDVKINESSCQLSSDIIYRISALQDKEMLSMASSITKKTKGRQNIKMEKIKDKTHLSVSFCKRRESIFRKAHELSILSGAIVAAIVFSPTGKVFTYANPSISEVMERFLTKTSQPLTSADENIQAEKDCRVAHINAKLEEKKKKLEHCQRQGKYLDNMLAENQISNWKGNDVKGLTLQQLQKSREAVEKAIFLLDMEINFRQLQAVEQFNIMQGQGYGYFVPTPSVGNRYDGNLGDLPPLPEQFSYVPGEGSGGFVPESFGAEPVSAGTSTSAWDGLHPEFHSFGDEGTATIYGPNIAGKSSSFGAGGGVGPYNLI